MLQFLPLYPKNEEDESRELIAIMISTLRWVRFPYGLDVMMM
jgi:hypothetical protein